MKINGTDSQAQLGVYKTTQLQGNNLEMGTIANTGATRTLHDRVALSDHGRLIADAQQAVAFIPDIRESLVSEIRADLENGSYVFDHLRSAEGMLRESMVNEAAMHY